MCNGNNLQFANFHVYLLCSAKLMRILLTYFLFNYSIHTLEIRAVVRLKIRCGQHDFSIKLLKILSKSHLTKKYLKYEFKTYSSINNF